MSLKKSIEELLAEIRDQLINLHATSTEMAAHLKTGVVNDLLIVTTLTFPAEGIIKFDFPASYGSVFVSNPNVNDVTASADTPQASAPTGSGSHPVPKGSWALVNLHGRALTLYGTAGDKVGVQVFTKPWPPAAGLVRSLVPA